MDKPAEKRHRNWHEDVFFGIHYDLHANEKDTELGREVTHDHLRDRWELTRPDRVQCDCKGHPGYTARPTEVGAAARSWRGWRRAPTRTP